MDEKLLKASWVGSRAIQHLQEIVEPKDFLEVLAKLAGVLIAYGARRQGVPLTDVLDVARTAACTFYDDTTDSAEYWRGNA